MIIFNKIVHGNVAIEFPTYFEIPRSYICNMHLAGQENSVGVGGGWGKGA